MCDQLESILGKRNIYSFDPFQHRLPCLAHVINLAITELMSVITKIAVVETTTSIWEYDPSQLDNRMVGDSLDVVATIRTLAIKVRCACSINLLTVAHRDSQIQCSGQRIEYFNSLQVSCGIDPPLSIPLHSNVRWGTAVRMLARSYLLRQVRSSSCKS